MGLFDSVRFECPLCAQPIIVQSKAGACLLDQYDAGAVPDPIADDIADDDAYCVRCDESFRIRRDSTRQKLVLIDENKEARELREDFDVLMSAVEGVLGSFGPSDTVIDNLTRVFTKLKKKRS